MIDVRICAKCPCCTERVQAKTDKNGNVVALASAMCDKVEDGVVLTGISEVPESCPYFLEHQLLAEDTFNSREDLREEVL